MFLHKLVLVTLLLWKSLRPGSGISEHLIHIVQENCTEFRYFDDSNQTCCMTLQELYDQNLHQNSLQVSVASGFFCLSSPLLFQGITNVTLTGDSETMTVLQCLQSDKKGAGLLFRNNTNVMIVNITIQNCGVLHNSTSFDSETNSILLFRSAVLFWQVTNLQLINVSTIHSNGIGVTMYDVTGNVLLSFCSFKNNSVYETESGTFPGGGGLYIEFTPLRNGHQLDNLSTGNYTINSCSFEQNQASTERVHQKDDEFRTFGQGGGLLICFRGTASKCMFNMSRCLFRNNSAVWGGGIHVMVSNSSHNNTLLIHDSNITNNQAKAGGGGMAVYLFSKNNCGVSDIVIECTRCNFTENIAIEQGGATMILARLHNDYHEDTNCDPKTNIMLYRSCIFSSNQASYSAAVDITTRLTMSEKFGISPIFDDCTFLGNKISNNFKGINGTTAKSAHLGKATFMAVMSKVTFQKLVLFRGNKGTAMYIFASKVVLRAGIQARFEDNTGKYGGAIALIFSFLSVEQHSYLTFNGNKAYEKGGAIYSYSVGEHELHQNIPALNCFLQCKGCQPFSKSNNLTLQFTNNSVGSQSHRYSNGNSIYATSLYSCASEQVIEATTANASAVLESIANFEFVDSDAHHEVTTSAYEFTLTEQPKTNFIPGKEEDLPVVTTDFWGHQLQSSYQVFILSDRCENGSIAIDVVYDNLPNQKIKLYGDPGATCYLDIARNGYQLLYIRMTVSLSQCPPGYVLMMIRSGNRDMESPHQSSRRECTCARYFDEHYRGIQKCNSTSFQSYIDHGFWAGYESDNASEENLVTAYCPHSFCSYNASTLISGTHLLPGTANKAILDTYICRKGRTGKLCGICLGGYSVYFHSPNYLCKENHYCSYGALFYILSELLPLSVLFAIILKFNISFTSGTLNGFLFYAQVIDTLYTGTLNHAEYYSDGTHKMIKASVFVYRFFNLNFFSLDSLSFCLWEGASTLDIIIIKFATIAFAFCLVLSVFIFKNITPKFKRCSSLRGSLKQSVIHGISTFLVVCFAQTVQVSFHIFTPGYMYRRGDKLVSTQVLYNGKMEFFTGKHLIYVVPALFATITVAIIPTLYLLWYPLGIKMLDKCRISETKFAKSFERIFFINKLKPVFDSFQGCYKDNFRFFAGLSFIYRIAFLAIHSFASGLTQFYVFAEVLLVTMLLLHSLSQPYKKPTHNALDSFLFADLALVNGLSLYIRTKASRLMYMNSILVSEILQVTLTAAPLICLLVYATVKLLSKLKCKPFQFFKKRKSSSELEDDLSYFLDSNRDRCDIEYSEF